MIRRKLLLMGRDIGREPGTIYIKGKSVLSKAPLWNDPAEIISTGNFHVSDGKKVVKVTETLRSVDDLDGVMAARDYIKVTEDTVKVYRHTDIYEFDGTETMRKNTSGGVNWVSNNYIAFTVSYPVGGKETLVGLCSHFPTVPTTGIFYVSDADYNCLAPQSTGVQLKIKFADLGFASMPDYDTAEPIFRQWMENEKANGTPMMMYTEITTPITTDITDTDLGQELLGLKRLSRLLADNENVEIEVVA